MMNNFIEILKETWNTGIRGFGIGEIIICLVIILLSWLLGKFFSNKLIDWLGKKADQTENELDDQIIESLRGPLGLIPIVFGFYLITFYLPLEGSLDFFATTFVKMLVIFAIFSVLANLAGPLLSLLSTKFMTEAMKDWLRKAIEVIVWIIAVAMILDIWGIAVGPIIAGLGLFTTKKILAGTYIGIIHIINENDSDGITRTPLGGFGNHSDTPNCFKLRLEHDNSWIGAIRDIEPDEEITWKYTLYEIK